MAFCHQLGSLQPWHLGEWFREPPWGFHSDSELNRVKTVVLRKPKPPGYLMFRHTWFQGVSIPLLCHSADHGGVCGCICTSEVVLCWPPAPVFRASCCCSWCHGQPWPWLCASTSSQAEGTAPVSIWLSGRSRCRRWWDPQLGVQTLKCSTVMVVIAAFVLPSEKKQSCKSRRVTPLSWPNGRTVDQDLLMLLCFQEEL